MNAPGRAGREARIATIVGLASLASAMGIGRFAFTPLFPLMQDSAGITLAQASWIASANYLGYLVGAVASYVAAVKAPLAARWGLVVVAASTLLTAFADTVARWVVLRLVAGAASALVLIGASAWALALLARSQRLRWSGWVFAGVGVGICLAGLPAIVADPRVFAWAWPLFGFAAAVSTIAVSHLARHAKPGAAAGCSFIVMALGVFLPAVGTGLGTLCLSAICVGGTFMVATMACLQQAQRVAGDV